MSLSRYKIQITGAVQGIGFRPFVYKEALKNAIKGHVFNDSRGVTIEAEGKKEDLENFTGAVRHSPPPFAQIHSFHQEELEPRGEAGFSIIKSRDLGEAETLISPDIATCADCLNDISSPDNRRYRYPFTNCTNCGPRYTIIEGVPYDRPSTAMKGFKMCPECEAEYNDPMDRRYHAQPNCCPVCGPCLTLVENVTDLRPKTQDQRPRTKDQGPLLGRSCVMGHRSWVHDKGNNKDVISQTTKLLREGKIIAIKGLGGFHLACDATNEGAVLRLRARKKRDEKPFAVMMPDVETVRRHCELSEAEEKLLTSAQKPIVLLRRKDLRHGTQDPGPEIVRAVAPKNYYLGVILPYTPFHHLLFKTEAPRHRGTEALIMTSANISDEPICFDNNEAFERLKDIADYFLIHDRDIYIRTDDSITRVMNGKPLILRRARGYAPQPVLLDTRPKTQDLGPLTNRPSVFGPGSGAPNILAVGSELKNTVCLLKNNKAFISQHIGDLENSASYESFEKSIDHLQELFDVKPAVIAHDMHPDYYSSRWALDRCLSTAVPQRRGQDCGTVELRNCGTTPALIGVQHHHAHIASCMAENQVGGPVIGIALDGTGYGTDGNIWGGEILVADFHGFERVAHFEYVPLPGGDAAIRNPWQIAVSYICASYLGASVPQCPGASVIKEFVPALRVIPDENIDLVIKMIEKRLNSPLTSSCGRLFDAVAAILGLCETVTFEGQAALGLEMITLSDFRHQTSDIRLYSYKIIQKAPCTIISYVDTVKDILDDIRGGVSGGEIGLRFHYTIIRALTEVAVKISQDRQLKEAALSGGCFQNVLLTEGLKNSLEKEGLTVYTHSSVPPNDGGISLGQSVIADRLSFPRRRGSGVQS